MKESLYRKRDRLSDDFTLIYKAPMEHILSACKHVSSFSLTVIGSIVAFKYVNGIEIVEQQCEVSYGALVSSGSDLIVFGIGFVAFNVMVLYSVSKYPLRIYKQKNK